MSEGYKKILVHISCRRVETVEIEVPYDYEGSYDVDWEDLSNE